MRLVLVLTALALVTAPSASMAAKTGGVTVPRGTNGGMTVPGEEAGDPGSAAGGAQAGDAEPLQSGGPDPALAGSSVPPAHAAQDEPAVPPQEEDPGEGGGVDVEVPVDDEGDGESPSRPATPATPFGGLAPTGMAVAAFALLGATAAAAGLGLRRLAR